MATAQQQEVIDYRRSLVSRLMARKLTQRQICKALEGDWSKGIQGFLNPDTGEPWSLMTINYDIKAIKAEWRQETNKQYEELVAELYGEYQELIKEAWKEGDRKEVRLLMKDVRDLLGLDEPQQAQIGLFDANEWKAVKRRNKKQIEDLPDEMPGE